MSDDIDWRARAKCRDHDPELWFPNQVHNRKARRDASLTARAICFECPVREQCLEWAIGVGERWAVAGGRDFGVQSAKKASASGVRGGGGRLPDEISAP